MLTNRSMPKSVIIPEIPYPDILEAASWLSRHFGFTEHLRIGSHRIQMTFDQGDIVLVTPAGNPLPKYSVMVRVQNVNLHYAQAVQEWVRIVNPPMDYPYGECQYTAEDLAGHRWTFSQTVEDVDPADWGGIPGK